MKTFKKLFAYSAIFALLATMMPTYANAASYDAELTEAYAYAKGKSITTMASIDDADMYGNLTRVAMAKMVANYVLDLNLQELDTTKECNFPDVSASLDEAYDNGVTKACQLGLMGVGIEKFNPNGIVTRAEFGTVLSRALWGEENNGGNPYYAKHLQALKDEGIMNEIDNPNMKEVRGYVMLMMMRADDAYTPTTGCSAEELLVCLTADNFKQCIAACSEDAEEEVVLPGHATVSLVSKAADQYVPMNAVNVKVGTIKLTAGENNTRVSSVEISREGLANLTDSKNRPLVYLKGGNIKTTAKAVSSSTNSVVVKFSPALDMKAGSSMNFDVMVSMDATADSVNSTHTFKVINVVVANGKSAGTPVTLGTIKTTSAKSKTISPTVKSADTTAKAGDRKTIAKVEVIFDSAAGIFNGFSLLGTTENKDSAPTNENLYDIFANAKAYIGDTEVGTVGLAKDKVIVEGLNKSVAKDGKVIVEIKSDVVYAKEKVKTTFTLEDIDALEGNFGFGMVGTTNNSSANITVDGSDITFKKVAIEKDVLPGTTQVKLFAGEIKTATDIAVQKITITPNLSNAGDFANLYSNGSAILKINGESFEIKDSDMTGGVAFDINNMEVYIDAGTTAKVEIIVNTKVPSPLVSARASYSVNLATVESADDSAITYTVAPRAGDTVKIAAGDIKLNKATVAGPTTESLFSNAEQEVGRFSIKANNDSATLKAFDLKDAASTSPLSNIEFGELFDGNLTLVNVANGEDVNATITYNVDTFEVRGMSLNIDKNETVNLKLMANLSSVKDYYGRTVQFEIQADSIDATTSVDNIVTNSVQTLSTNAYTFKVTAPLITMTKNSDNMFKVVIKNIDDDADIDVEDLRFRVRASSDDNNFDGKVCLTNDVSQAECTGADNFGTWITDLALTTINNNDELTTYILVDGASIEPSLLQAQISELKYDIKSGSPTVEKYNVVAQ